MQNNDSKDSIEGVDWLCFMNSIENILHTRSQLTVNSQQLVVNSKLSTDSKLLTDKEIDYCLAQTRDLINDTYAAWYRLRLYKLGVSEYMERANKARKYGKNPSKYFSSILKR